MHRVSAVKLLLASLLLLSCSAATYAQTCAGGNVDLKACGAVGNDAADDSPALQAALDALAAAGGGTLSVPEGRYRLASPVSKNFLNLAASVIIRGQGSSSVFHFASGGLTTNIHLNGAESLLVENLVFAGTPGTNHDAKVAFFVGGTEKATFRRTDWYGLASVVSGGAVLWAEQTDLLVENSSFRGCGGHAFNLVPIVRVTNWYSTKFSDTDFIDYGTLHGVFHSKTPQGVFSWVHLASPIAEKEGRALFSRMFLDEGAQIGLLSETGVPNIVRFEHIGMNVNSTDAGVGIKITGARHASISHSHFGFASATPRNAIEFFNVGTAVVDQTELRDQANRILVDSLTKSLTISDSNVETLVASAESIRLSDSNISTLQIAAASRVTTRTGGRLTATGLALGGGEELVTTNQTGTGSLVMSNAPTLTSPVITNPSITGLTLTNPSIGAATGTSLSLGGGTPLTTTNRTGTGNLVLATSPTIAGATLTSPTISGATLTSPTISGATLTTPTLTAPNIGAATATSLSIGGGTALTTTNRTGTGNLVLATAPTITGATLTSPTITGATLSSPTLTTPNLGAATGTSLSLGGGTPLTTTNRTGTGNLVLATSPTIAGATLTSPTIAGATLTSPTISGATLSNPTIAGASLTNATLVTPNLGAATGTSLSLGGGTPLTTTNRTGTGNLVLATSPTIAGATLTSPTISGATLTSPTISGATLTTPNLGAASGSSLSLGGGTPLTTTNRTGTGNLVLATAPTLAGATLTNPSISNATISNSTLSGPAISNATITGATLSGATLTSPTISGATLTSPTISGATLTNPTITGASLTNATLVTPNLGAATGTSLSLGGGTPLATTSQTGTGSLVMSNAPTLLAPTLAGRVARTVLELAPGVADPSVTGGDVFQVANAAPTTVSNFRDGAEGQLIVLVFSDANTTVSDAGPDIRLRGDFSSKPDAVLILIRAGGAWFEISRSIDSKPFAAPKTAPAVVMPAAEDKTEKSRPDPAPQPDSKPPAGSKVPRRQ